jgi:hypothetical protein
MSFVSKIKKVMMHQETPEWKSNPKYQGLAENTDDEPVESMPGEGRSRS